MLVEWYDIPPFGEPSITVIPKEADECVIRLTVLDHFLISRFLGVHNLHAQQH